MEVRMGQEVLFSILPRNNFIPSDLVYNRRVSRADKTSCRSSLNEDNSGADEDKFASESGEKNRETMGNQIDERA